MDTIKQKEFDEFWKAIQTEIHVHPVITENVYCKWFKKGEFTKPQLLDLFKQFAVFSKWFLLAQMMRLLNASDLEAETHARYILANELGVKTHPGGSTEDMPFKTSWAHINWLRDTAKTIGLSSIDLGSWETASPATRAFIHGLEKTYGSKDGEIGRGASYAIETWAAWGLGLGQESESNNFWKELITGIEIYNRNNRNPGEAPIPLDFFLFHFNCEKDHGDNVLEELKGSFFKPGFDGGKFIMAGKQALEAIHTFWLGLDQTRRELEEPQTAARNR